MLKSSEFEVGEKDQYHDEDALNATRASVDPAVEEGILRGGGVALLDKDNNISLH